MQTTWCEFERLPDGVSGLRLNIRSMYPEWAGEKPGALRRGTRSRRLMIRIPCENCREPVERNLYEVEKKLSRGQTEIYCGHECRGQTQRRKCETCGKPRPDSRSRGARFCSNECRPSRKELRPLVCPQCWKVFQPLSHRTQYCSRVCANRAHSDRMVGEGNSHFKDGTSYALWFKSMRPLILERDTGCVICGTTHRLVIHHIDHQPPNNHPENLVAICRTHHGQHHKYNTTPWPWLSTYATKASTSMTSRWKEQVASLQNRFSSTTA